MSYALNLPTVDADSPAAAVAKLARDGMLPVAGTFWVRIVIEAACTKRALSCPLTAAFESFD